ncbi:MAG: DUF1634 domain-containing protein [Thaumarchaeota archaeon]|nr:DUF1634 domain-containing protein [Nitrososphaerota archaeon]
MKREVNDLETVIGFILLGGVVVSLVVEGLGLLDYVITLGSLNIVFSPEWQTGGKDFFVYTWSVLASLPRGVTPVSLIGLGVILLMITPYLRVLASLIYFGVEKNLKYVLITAFVLVVLTASLLAY